MKQISRVTCKTGVCKLHSYKNRPSAKAQMGLSLSPIDINIYENQLKPVILAEEKQGKEPSHDYVVGD
jgi:hypothetical protein